MMIDNNLSIISVVERHKRQSQLLPFQSEIVFLKEEGYNESVILAFLQEFAQLNISQQALNSFFHQNLNKRVYLTDEERRKIMSDLEDFLNKHQPTGKASRLTPFRDDIFQLKALGYSAQDILLYLKKYKNLEVSAGTLSTYIRREKERMKNKLARLESEHQVSGSLKETNKKKKGRPAKNVAIQETTNNQTAPKQSTSFKLMNEQELQEYMNNL